MRRNIFFVGYIALCMLLCSCGKETITVIQTPEKTDPQTSLYAAVTDSPEALKSYMNQFPTGQFGTAIPVFTYKNGQSEAKESLFYLPTVDTDGKVLFYTLITVNKDQVSTLPLDAAITQAIEGLRSLTSESQPMILIKNTQRKGNSVAYYAVVGYQAVCLDGTGGDKLSIRLPNKKDYSVSEIEK